MSTLQQVPAQAASHRGRRWLLGVAGVALAVLLAVWLRPLEVVDAVTRSRLWTEGFHSRYAEAAGLRVHYYAGGSGPAVVLVHGLGSRAEDWANIMPYLAHGGHTVYAVDLPGYGRSDRPADASYSIAYEARALAGFMDTLHLRNADVAGWSMGGWVAGLTALDHPELVRRLVLCDSAGLYFQLGFDPALFAPNTPEKLGGLVHLLAPMPFEHVPSFIARDIFRREAEDGWVIERSVRQMLTGADLLDQHLAELHLPVLIVWGKQDQMIPLSAGIVFHEKISQSILQVFDGCGHLAPGQCAGRIGPRMVDFLNANPPLPPHMTEVAQRNDIDKFPW